jgi:hypothetical protein
MQKAFGTDLALWKTCRERLLPTPALRDLFANDFLRSVGLA